MSDFKPRCGFMKENTMVEFRTEKKDTTKEIAELTLIEKLYAIQRECPAILKNAEAGTGFKWSYATLNSVMDTLKPLLDKFGIFMHWYFDGSQLILVLRNLASTTDFIETKMVMPMDEDFQDIGKRITYYLNRLILGIFGIVAEEDTGGEEKASRKSRRGKKSKSRRSRRSRDEDDDDEDDEDEDEDEEDDDDEDEDEDEDDDDEEDNSRRSRRSGSRNSLPRRSRGSRRR